MKKIVAFGASSSSKSMNKQLATYTAQLIDNSHAIILDLNNFEMPIYSEDFERLNGIPKEAYDFKEIIKEADGIIISFAEHNGAYTAAFKWNYKFTGLHRNVVCDALMAEGIPVFKGYHRLMCDHPMFKRKIAFGNNQYPWMGNNIDYNSIDVTNARHLVENEFLGFLQIGYPNEQNDMDDIVNAFFKIIKNIDDLKKYNITNQELKIGR